MVRERVSNRVFHDTYFIPPPAPEGRLDPAAHFASRAPLEVDIGCGRGRFLLARARRHPEIHFLGLDQSLLRLRKIDRKAVATNLTNIRFIQGNALSLLAALPAGCLNACYVFFPDPWPKRRHQRRRLVSPRLVDLLFEKLAAGGVIHMCTDHEGYFETMLATWLPDPRFRSIPAFVPAEEEETDFGLIFRSKNLPTHRCSFEKAG